MALAARKVMNYIEKGGKKPNPQNNFSAFFFFEALTSNEVKQSPYHLAF